MEAEKSQSKENVIENNLTKNKKKQNTLIEHTINQNDLIDDLYKKFGKKKFILMTSPNHLATTFQNLSLIHILTLPTSDLV